MGAEYPLSIGGHTLNLYNGSPAELADRSGNGNDGTVSGTTITDTGGGKFAGSFDGVDDYIDCGDNSDFNFHDKDFSISIWIKTDKYSKILQRGQGGGNYFGYYLTAHPSGVADFLTVAPVERVQSTTIITNDVWVHIVATLQSGTGRMYINGVLENSQSGMNPTSTSEHLNLGRNSIGSSFFGGEQDNASVYSRAISSTEVTALHNAGRTATKYAISTNSLLAFYDFQPPDRALSTLWKTWNYWDLLAWFPFPTNNANDYSENSNNGTVIGATYDGSGKGYEFDGVNDYIDCGDNSMLEGMANLTMVAWAKTDYSGGNNYNIIFDKWINGGSHATAAYILGMHSNGAFAFILRTTGGVYEGVTPVGYNDGEWHHVVVVYNGSTLVCYVDGILRASYSDISGNVGTVNNALKIGCGADHAAINYFDGNIDDVRILNRALTASESLEIYNGTKDVH